MEPRPEDTLEVEVPTVPEMAQEQDPETTEEVKTAEGVEVEEGSPSETPPGEVQAHA